MCSCSTLCLACTACTLDLFWRCFPRQQLCQPHVNVACLGTVQPDFDVLQDTGIRGLQPDTSGQPGAGHGQDPFRAIGLPAAPCA